MFSAPFVFCVNEFFDIFSSYSGDMDFNDEIDVIDLLLLNDEIGDLNSVSYSY